jgi:hypothetical protein
MDDPRTADGVEHLQAAARELLLAARSFLNVVEEVVEDPERFTSAATGVVELLRDGLGGAIRPTSPLEPWERVAWQDPDLAPDADEPATATEAEAAGADAGGAGVDETEPAPARTRRRVKRIAVD